MENGTGDDGEDVEHVIRKAFQRVHMSFQSTSLCNISTINALNTCKTSAMIRARGRFYNSRYWGIDMNKVRKLYLGTYSYIESIDQLINNFRMKYRCWKYCHSPIIHTMSLAVFIAYGMYLEVK